MTRGETVLVEAFNKRYLGMIFGNLMGGIGTRFLDRTLPFSRV